VSPRSVQVFGEHVSSPRFVLGLHVALHALVEIGHHLECLQRRKAANHRPAHPPRQIRSRTGDIRRGRCLLESTRQPNGQEQTYTNGTEIPPFLNCDFRMVVRAKLCGPGRHRATGGTLTGNRRA